MSPKWPWSTGPKLTHSSSASESDGVPDVEEKALSKFENLFEAYGVSYRDDVQIDDYREMIRRDPTVKSAVRYKEMSRIASGWTVVPADDSDEAQEIADFVEDQMRGIDGTFAGFLRGVMRALPYTLSVSEIVYQPITEGRWRGKWGWKALKYKRPENFKIICDAYGNLDENSLQQRVTDGGFDWQPLDYTYFVLWVPDHEGDWIGDSDLRAAYRYSKEKDLIGRMWNLFLERFAQPTPVVKYPLAATLADKLKALNFMKKLRGKKVIAVPLEWETEFLEAKAEGKGYAPALDYKDRQIRLSVLVPSLVVEEGSHGAYSLGKQHFDTFVLVLKSLGAEIEDVVNDQPIRRMVDFNFNTDLYPRFEFNEFSEVDLVLLSESVERFVTSGVINPREPWIRERAGFPPAEDGDEIDNTKEEESEKPSEKTDATLTKFAKWPKNKHGAKMHFDTIRKQWDVVEQSAVSELAVIHRAMRDALVDRGKKILAAKDYPAIEKLQLKYLGDFRAVYEAMLFNAVHHGAHAGLSAVERGIGKTIELPEAIGKFAGGKFSGVSREPLTRTEYKVPVEVAEYWAAKVPQQRALIVEYNRRAFTITGVHRDNLIGKAKLIIQKGIDRGISPRALAEELNAVFEPYLSNPGALDAGVANPYRVESMVRTNYSEAFNQGFRNMCAHPELVDFIQAWEYSAILDDRTTPFCESYHGTIMRGDSARMSVITPPNHYQCRSMLIPIVEGETWKETKAPPGIEPQDGFRY